MKVPSDAGDRIRIEMVRCGYTAQMLSERTMISPMVLRGILVGRGSSISTRNLCALASAFGYTAADFADLLCAPAESQFWPSPEAPSIQDTREEAL